ncbi:MAG: hydrogenase formation protein HypD [Desulfuromonadales bacterium]
MSVISAFRDPAVAGSLLGSIEGLADGLSRPVTFMEVCGTHTMAIYQNGIRAMLPDAIRLISGPGCPVCVTPVGYVDHAVALARREDTVVTTFGDMMRVPGSTSSLTEEKARGADVRIVYSPLDAVSLASRTPEKTVVFLGVGFETTTPAVAGAIVTARRESLDNFYVLGSHKTMPRPMAALSADPELQIGGYICPAHVSTIIGAEGYRPLADRHGVPCVITGFEPVDILQGVEMMVRQAAAGTAEVQNQYSRYVKWGGNVKARDLLYEVFEPCDARWRGIGDIPGSGLRIRDAYAACDASVHLPVSVEEAQEPPGCRCGDVLKGKVTPKECSLFRTVCSPLDPVGACMVSSEGTCAAEYKYGTT